MKCPHCGVENADETLTCISCGQLLNDTAAQPEEPAYEPETPVYEPEAVTAAPAGKRRPNPALIVVLALAVIALVLVAVILVRQSIPAAEPEEPTSAADPAATGADGAADASGETAAVTPLYPVTSYTNPALVPEDTMDAQAGEYDGKPLSNRLVNYYYWAEYHYLCNAYGSNLSLWMDPYAPLDGQAVNADNPNYTWQDYLLESAQRTMQETYALLDAAKAAGFTLSASDAATLAQMEQNLQSAATANGYEDTGDYLRATYGCGADTESFLAFLSDSMVASAYARELHNSFDYSDEEITDYYNNGSYAADGLAQSDVRNIDVRHILIMPETGEGGEKDWEAARAEAERIYALWQEDPTEENFAALAETYSQDPGSNTNGGLYTGVTEGRMVQPFNDWCFDASRQLGDTGIVETDYGYHIMYFAGRAERPAWMETVLADMKNEAYYNAVAALMSTHSFSLDYAAVVLASPSGMYLAAE